MGRKILIAFASTLIVAITLTIVIAIRWHRTWELGPLATWPSEFRIGKYRNILGPSGLATCAGLGWDLVGSEASRGVCGSGGREVGEQAGLEGLRRGLPKGVGLRVVCATKGHRVLPREEAGWVMYVWGPGGWDIGDGWVIRCGERYYAPEEGCGVVVGGEFEILPLRSEGVRYLLVVSKDCL